MHRQRRAHRRHRRRSSTTRATPASKGLESYKCFDAHNLGAQVTVPELVEAARAALQAIDVSKEARGFAIATTSANKEAAFKLLDFMASPEGQVMDRLGFEGQEFTREGDTIKLTDKISTWYARFMATANWTPPVEWKSQAARIR